MSKDGAKAIVWTNVETPSGYVLSITSRDGGDVKESYMRIIEFLADHPQLTPFNSYRNQWEDPDTVVEEAERLGGEVTKDKVTGDYLGIVPFMKVSELKPGQTYELLINEYTHHGGKINFYGPGSEYPHTHVLNNVGVAKMAELFTPEWDDKFPVTEEKKPFPGGDMLLKIKASTKVKKTGNPWANLDGARRP